MDERSPFPLFLSSSHLPFFYPSLFLTAYCGIVVTDCRPVIIMDAFWCHWLQQEKKSNIVCTNWSNGLLLYAVVRGILFVKSRLIGDAADLWLGVTAPAVEWIMALLQCNLINAGLAFPVVGAPGGVCPLNMASTSNICTNRAFILCRHDLASWLNLL